jgi:SM-20-related protein
VMLAVYPPGAHYSPHVDNPAASNNGRVLTAIVYLNDGWEASHGGRLRIHSAADPSTIVEAVDPISGRLVVFWSDDRVPHSVQATDGYTRCALTCWYMEAVVPAGAPRTKW